MKHVDIETKYTFYDYSKAAIENASGGKNQPRLRDANGELVPDKTLTGKSVAFEASDFVDGALEKAAKAQGVGILAEDILGDLNFGLKNKQQGRLRLTVVNDTKPAGVKEMRKAVGQWALEEGDMDLVKSILTESISKESLAKLYQEHCAA